LITSYYFLAKKSQYLVVDYDDRRAFNGVQNVPVPHFHVHIQPKRTSTEDFERPNSALKMVIEVWSKNPGK